ncbi:substrate-binding periplasmic protein [Thalassotalea agariperforans]
MLINILSLVVFLFYLVPVFSYGEVEVNEIDDVKPVVNINKAERRITLLTGLPKPPFILEDGQSGLQLDIIREALACENIDVEFINIPAGRNITSLKTLGADGMITLPADFDHPGIFVSTPYIYYQNVAVSLTDNHLNIEQFDDLTLLSVVAFQNAKKFLPPAYANAVNAGIEYREIADQNKQIEMFYRRNIEVIILDLSILKYFLKHHKASIYQKDITIHSLFDKGGYAIGFKDENLLARFEKGLTCLKENQGYQKIIAFYGE